MHTQTLNPIFIKSVTSSFIDQTKYYWPEDELSLEEINCVREGMRQVSKNKIVSRKEVMDFLNS